MDGWRRRAINRGVVWVEYNDRRRVCESSFRTLGARWRTRRKKKFFLTVDFFRKNFPFSSSLLHTSPFFTNTYIVCYPPHFSPDRNRDSFSLLVNCSSSFHSQSPLAFFLANRRKNWSCYCIETPFFFFFSFFLPSSSSISALKKIPSPWLGSLVSLDSECQIIIWLLVALGRRWMDGWKHT